MKTLTHRFGDLLVEAPADWCDTTDGLRGPHHPFTLTKCEDGVGALQFSIAAYRGGPLPNPTPSDLLEMVEEFGARKGLGDLSEEVSRDGMPMVAAASYYHGEDYVRVWYVSDGSNFALTTYLCKWEYRELEIGECEKIVNSLKFKAA